MVVPKTSMLRKGHASSCILITIDINIGTKTIYEIRVSHHPNIFEVAVALTFEKKGASTLHTRFSVFWRTVSHCNYCEIINDWIQVSDLNWYWLPQPGSVLPTRWWESLSASSSKNTMHLVGIFPRNLLCLYAIERHTTRQNQYLFFRQTCKTLSFLNRCHISDRTWSSMPSPLDSWVSRPKRNWKEPDNEYQNTLDLHDCALKSQHIPKVLC